ncbi:2-amino-4-hydroxy-6-hydroxymethyldihydropteridine pyrophosphokinase [Elysia marginata]|uniref:2-amino-4-hydroxy-6-hydroxymethyldihydropteridine diphosphokinase n=1 Tax=Elysia marginata TaxID=1093978 RepID=A0AAV4HML6_9GAST|nr:2-amino-4-hydroxy-6-hydroxymethyldihydropteridine pyrophosphokinase [Elysia marginata]
MSVHKAYIALGSNLDNPMQQLVSALQALAKLPNCQLLKQSSFYASAPMGPQDQPDYINAVALISTTIEALALLDQLQAIELDHQRKRERRWGPRTLDLDLILFGESIIDHPRLQVPHVGLKERNFVLYPLAEIAPDLVLPDGETLQHCVQLCPLADLSKLSI